MNLTVSIGGKEYKYKKPVLGIPSMAQRIRVESDTLDNIELAWGNRVEKEEFEKRIAVIDAKIAELESKPIEDVRDELKAVNESKTALMEARANGEQVCEDWWKMMKCIIEIADDDLRLENLAKTMTEGELQAIVSRFFTLRTEDIRSALSIMTGNSSGSE
jgi:hypothetical protein